MDLTDYPALRYHSSGTRAERDDAREAAAERYGSEVIDAGKMYRFVRAEIDRLLARAMETRR